jgi:hypothetical protein
MTRHRGPCSYVLDPAVASMNDQGGPQRAKLASTTRVSDSDDLWTVRLGVAF